MMRRQHTGFTLLEVLVALAILAIAITALVKGSNDHTANAAYLRERSIASWVASNELAKLQLARQWPGLGKRDGKADMGGISWRWQAEVGETPDKDVRKLKITVSQDGKSGATATLQAFLGNPKLRSSGQRRNSETTESGDE